VLLEWQESIHYCVHVVTTEKDHITMIGSKETSRFADFEMNRQKDSLLPDWNAFVTPMDDYRP
jgi:hypothetical protein